MSGIDPTPTEPVGGIRALRRLKPAASARVHLLLAALVWTAPGIGLTVFGARWAVTWASPWCAPLLAACVVAGLLKARVIMAPPARRTRDRIVARGDGLCLFGFLSLRSWFVVFFMMALGRWLRGGVLPLHQVGFVYTFVGVALLSSSVHLWRAVPATRTGT